MATYPYDVDTRPLIRTLQRQDRDPILLLDITLAQLYRCVMIPVFDENGNLPPGVYEAQWDEIVQRFGWTSRRLELLAGLKRALEPFRKAGCQRIFVNGSFVTEKDEPGDIDVAWDPNGQPIR